MTAPSPGIARCRDSSLHAAQAAFHHRRQATFLLAPRHAREGTFCQAAADDGGLALFYRAFDRWSQPHYLHLVEHQIASSSGVAASRLGARADALT